MIGLRATVNDFLLRFLSREAVAAIAAVILQVTGELSPEVAGPLAGPQSLVDEAAQEGEELARPLDLVEEDQPPRLTLEEELGFVEPAPVGFTLEVEVEGGLGGAVRHRQSEGRLAYLARSQDGDDGVGGEGFVDSRLKVADDHSCKLGARLPICKTPATPHPRYW